MLEGRAMAQVIGPPDLMIVGLIDTLDRRRRKDSGRIATRSDAHQDPWRRRPEARAVPLGGSTAGEAVHQKRRPGPEGPKCTQESGGSEREDDRRGGCNGCWGKGS